MPARLASWCPEQTIPRRPIATGRVAGELRRCTRYGWGAPGGAVMARALYTMAGATMARDPGAERSRRLIAWRRRLEGRRRVHDLEIPLSGVSASAGGPGGAPGAPEGVQRFVIAAPVDPDGVLDEAVAEGGGGWHMPYWATPWASGLFLAETVLARPEALRGRRVLELGCGLGTTAIGAVLAQGGAGGGEGGLKPAGRAGGGVVIAADVFAETLAYCRYNVLRNTGRVVRTLLADWRTAGGQEALVRAGPFDLVLAADVLYEPEDVAPLLELAPRLVARGRRAVAGGAGAGHQRPLRGGGGGAGLGAGDGGGGAGVAGGGGAGPRPAARPASDTVTGGVWRAGRGTTRKLEQAPAEDVDQPPGGVDVLDVDVPPALVEAPGVVVPVVHADGHGQAAAGGGGALDGTHQGPADPPAPVAVVHHQVGDVGQGVPVRQLPVVGEPLHGDGAHQVAIALGDVEGAAPLLHGPELLGDAVCAPAAGPAEGDHGPLLLGQGGADGDAGWRLVGFRASGIRCVDLGHGSSPRLFSL